MQTTIVNITILGKNGDNYSSLTGVTIKAIHLNGNVLAEGTDEEDNGKYRLEIPYSPLELWITVATEGFVPQKRYFNVYSSVYDQRFILLMPDDSYYYQCENIQPCVYLDNQLGLLIEKRDELLLDQISFLTENHGLSADPDGEFMVYEWSENNVAQKEEAIAAFRNSDLVVAAGPILKSGNKKQIFTGFVFMQPLHRLSDDEFAGLVGNILSTYNSLEQTEIRTNRLVCFKTQLIDGLLIHELVHQLSNLEGVAFCYPELIAFVQQTAIIPTDYMTKDDFAMAATNLPEAYQRLQNLSTTNPDLGSNFKFGNSQIVTAIMDTGIQSVNGTVINPELNTGVAKSTSFLQTAVTGGSQSTIDIFSVAVGTISIDDVAHIGELNGENESLPITNITSPATGVTRLHFSTNVIHSYSVNTVVDINRIPKIHSLYDFSATAYTSNGSSYPAHNDNLGLVNKAGWPSNGLPSDHGTAVAGMVAATSGNKAPIGTAAYGMAGVAPNTRLIGLVHPNGEVLNSYAIEWIAGLDATTISGYNYPAILSPSADIYNASLGLGETSSALDPRVKLALDRSTSRGRNGRGMPLFLSSGNDDIEFGTPAATLANLFYSFANYERTFMIGSSDNLNNRTSSGGGNGSNYGANLDFCAPGSIVPATTINGKGGTASFPLITKTVLGPAAPLSPGDAQNVISSGTTNIYLNDVTGLAQDMWASIYDYNNERKEDVYIRQVIGGANNEIVVTSDNPEMTVLTLPAPGTFQTHVVSNSLNTSVDCKLVVDAKLLGTTTAVVNNTDTTITIASASDPNVKSGQELFIGVPVANNPAASWLWRRERLVATGPSTASGANWSIPVTAVQSAPGGGYPITTTQVILSYSNLRANFGGTSAASPFAAGIGALVLGVKPTLTWVELRQILRDTAQKTGSYNYNYNALKPGHSKELGYGILDADAAVEAAINYTHAERDLIIRNNLQDEGTSLTTTVQSPDIWVRSLPAVSDKIMLDAISGTTPIPFTKDGPHFGPYHNHDRVIYTRIHNRGTSLSNLDCWVRFYIAESNGVPAAGQSTLFPWPDAWPFPDMPVTAYSAATTNFLGEVKIPAGQIAAGQEAIVSMIWPQAIKPGLNADHTLTTNNKMYVLVEITPHDGLMVGTGVDSNNNISYREVVFTENKPPEIEFLDTSGENPLPRINLVSSSGVPVTTDFKFRIKDLEAFIHQTTELEATRTLEDGTTEQITWTYNGTVWTPDPTAPTWMTMNNSFVSVAGNLSGDPASMLFNGSFDLSKAYTNLKLKVTFTYDQLDDAAVLQTGLTTESTYVINVLQGVAPTGVGVQEFAKPTLHIFADLDTVSPSPVQTNAMAFGPVAGNESNKFRVTSSFTSTSPVKAYAAVTGTVAIQKENSDRINLIIRPLIQSNSDLTPVKYFIYRGLRRDNFIEASGDNMIPETTPNLSPFMQELYDQHNDRYVSNPPAPQLKSKALGWFPLQNGTLTLDSLFFSTDPDFALPVVQKGTELGQFFIDAGHEFGFEIVLEEGEIQIELNNAREPFYEIDVTGITDPLLNKAAREELRHYIDPAGYYGLHFDSGVKIPGTNAPLKQAALYTDFISYFHTANTVYLDIRNENGYSMNYYDNYNGPTGSTDEYSQLQLSFFGVNTITPYSTNGWPLVIRKESSATTTAELNPFFLKFKSLDNEKPTLYAERGFIEAGGISEDHWALNLEFFNPIMDTPPNTWTTRNLKLNIPNVVDPADSSKRLNVASSIKFHWLRSQSPSVWPLKVVKREHYTDNLFGPVDIDKLVTKKFIIPLKKVQWFELQGLKYVNIPGGFGNNESMYHHGFAFDEVSGDERVIFFATYSTSRFGYNRIQLQFADGVNSEDSFFHTNYVFKGLRLVVDTIQEDLGGSAQEVKVLQFEAFPYIKSQPFDALILGLTKDEVDDIKGLSGLNAAIHDRYIKLEEVPSPGGPDVPYDDLTSGNTKHYFKYKLGVQGQDATGNYATVFPANPNDNVYVYTFDRYFFASKAFAQNQSEVADAGISYEESNIMARPEPNTIIAYDATMLGLVTTFEANVAAVADDENALQNLKSLVESAGTGIWNQAMASVKNANYAAPDTRSFYWARLRMRIAIKEHPAVTRSGAIRKELLKAFETKSRGYDAVNFTATNPAFAGQGIDFSTIKKVLISGFDPFELSPENDQNIYGDNLSGAAVLGMHDTIIKNNLNVPVAIVQGAIFPVRYEDFDQDGGEGVVEAFYKNHITPGANEVQYAITMSRDYDPVLFMDRFAVRKRGEGGSDNNNQSGSSISVELPASLAGAKFIESTLDVTKIVPVDAPSNNGLYPIYYNQDFEFESPDGTTNKYAASLPPSSNYLYLHGHTKIEDVVGSPMVGQAPSELSSDDLAKVTPIKGSGGQFLSNECFYRVAALRSTLNPTLPSGHLHLPHYQATEETKVDDYDATKSSNTLVFIMNVVKNAVQ